MTVGEEINITKCAICDCSPSFDEEYDWYIVGRTKIYFHRVCGRKLIGKFLDEKFKKQSSEGDTPSPEGEVGGQPFECEWCGSVNRNHNCTKRLLK